LLYRVFSLSFSCPWQHTAEKACIYRHILSQLQW